MAEIKQTLNLGDLLKYEDEGFYSRDRATLTAGQTLVLGTVLGLVTATGKVKQLDPSATDGSQLACGVLLQDCDAYLVDRDDALMLARHGTVSMPNCLGLARPWCWCKTRGQRTRKTSTSEPPR